MRCLLLALALVLPACNGLKFKRATAFHADGSGLPGVYLVGTVQNDTGTTQQAVDPEDGANQQLWLFDDETVSLYAPGVHCPDAQPYSIDANELILEETDTCPADRWPLAGQSDGTVTFVRAVTFGGRSYTRTELYRQKSKESVTETLFSWSISSAATVPEKLKPYLPVEPEAAAVTAARSGFQEAFGTLKLSPAIAGNAFVPLLPITTEQKGAYDAVILQGGKALSPDATLSSLATGLACVVAIPVANLGQLGGYTGTAAIIRHAAPVRTQGIWKLDVATSDPTLLDNTKRQNKVTVTFADKSGVTLECSQPRLAGPITFAGVQAALGSLATLEAP